MTYEDQYDLWQVRVELDFTEDHPLAFRWLSKRRPDAAHPLRPGVICTGESSPVEGIVAVGTTLRESPARGVEQSEKKAAKRLANLLEQLRDRLGDPSHRRFEAWTMVSDIPESSLLFYTHSSDAMKTLMNVRR